MLPIVNIAAYKFADLSDLRPLRDELRELCLAHELLGTILLSPEGINLFVAGTRRDIDRLLTRLRNVHGLADLHAKESFSAERPFNRMLVKIKHEIIAFGVEGIAPARYTSRRLPAKQLMQWLDSGKPVTLLDTRNNFEIEAGTFRNAVAAGVDDFRDFPAAVGRLPEQLKDQPVVTFCTGGIRCEKAAPYLERAGFREVYQLDGGILKYLEECGGAHYDGQCFVFDKRVALDASLNAGGLRQCFVCQSVLSPEEYASPQYVEGQSCPRCYQTPVEAMASLIERRHAAIRKVTSPLPGSVPYDNVRPISVPLRLDGMELLDFLDAMKTHLSRQLWQEAAESGRLVCRGEAARPGRIVRSGERFFHKMPATVEPGVSVDIEVLHEDDNIVVINKPAPLPMHPCGRFSRNTLTYILDMVYHPLKLRPLHRLDADTTGVVVLGKTRGITRNLQKQFESGQVNKTYLARVHGHPIDDTFECNVPLSTAPGEAGARLPHDNGAPSRTRFRVRQRLSDGTAVLEVQPLTGRTNQIRIHLWTLGYPILGDPIYKLNGLIGTGRTLELGAERLCLHASSIEFARGAHSPQERYNSPNPTWNVIERS